MTRFLACLSCFILLLPAFSQIPLGDNRGHALPPSYKVSRIRSVHIRENGAWAKDLSSSDETESECSAFVLCEKDVRDFFRSSRPIDWYTWDYLPYTRCHAIGEITFVNGDKGRWFIDRNRRGSLMLADGRLGYFYGEKARAKVFDAPMGLAADPVPNRAARSLILGRIVSVTFSQGGSFYTSDAQKAGQCSFVLNEAEVRRFFSNARQVAQADFSRATPGECHAEGGLRLEDGREAEWLIEDTWRGVLVVKGEEFTYFLGANPRQGAGK